MGKDKRTPTATDDARQRDQINHSSYRAIKLSPDEYTELEKLIPDSSKQFKRMVKHVAFHPDTVTTQLCIACASVNLSDVARKHNHLIEPAGFRVDCYKPPYRIDNRFGERSNQYLWGLYTIGGDK